RPLVVDPLFHAHKSGAAGDLVDFSEPEFVTGFGPDRLSRPQRDLEIHRAYAHGLRLEGPEMHLDPALLLVVDRFMAEAAQVEVALKLPVDPCKQVQIEGRRDTGRVVISGYELRYGLDQIRAQQERVTWPEQGPDGAQEGQRRTTLEISDRAAEEQNEKLLSGSALRCDLPEAVNVRVLDRLDVDGVDRRKLVLAGMQSGGRDVDRKIQSVIAPGERFQNPTGFSPAAAA